LELRSVRLHQVGSLATSLPFKANPEAVRKVHEYTINAIELTQS
jgi:hypothetical protein